MMHRWTSERPSEHHLQDACSLDEQSRDAMAPGDFNLEEDKAKLANLVLYSANKATSPAHWNWTLPVC